MPGSAWICPSCQRRVPRTIAVCRCGHEWTGSEESVADLSGEVSAAVPVAAGKSPAAMIVLAVVLIGGVIALIAGLKPRPTYEDGGLKPRPTYGDAGLQPRPTEDAEEEPSRVPQWPNDPSLWKTSAVPVAASTPAVAPSARAHALEDVIGMALPAVALVETPGGRGTGFFIAPDTVITNAHVVEAHAYVTLKLAAGETMPGRVTERSDAVDLAAIKVSNARAGQPTLALGASRDVRIGQEIYAIGSPLGLQNTVTRGIVSAFRQAGSVLLVQTDAAINPGNSGGPLIDRSGRVVAVATMRMAGRAEALGFGVGAEHVHALLEGRAPQSGTSVAARPSDAFAPGRGDDADGDRATGEELYERFLVEAARRADQLDQSWASFVGDCLGGRAPATRSDRGWYVLWEKFDDSKVSPACTRFVTDFKMAAREFSGRMTEAADRARSAGVYPGVCRQLRQRHRLDSPDW